MFIDLPFTFFIAFAILFLMRKAARSMLNWSANELAIKSEIGVASIRRYEMQDSVRLVNTTNLDLHSKVVMYRHQSQVDGCAPKHA
jgi:hypothetical protein